MNNFPPPRPTHQEYAELEAEIVKQSRALHKAQQELYVVQNSLRNLHNLLNVWERVVQVKGFRDE